MIRLIRIFILTFYTIICFASYASARTIIRDVEIESVLAKLSAPIIKAADLSSNNVNIYIIQDSELNAYVSGGQNIFINTGLMTLSEDPRMLAGVLAHEIGHIAGGHLVRSVDEYQNTAIKSTIGYMLGAAAAAAGSPQAAQAIIAGSGHIANRQLLKYTRGHEESADQAALKFLDKANYPADGLIELLKILYNKETAIYEDLNPYTTTHPLSKDRILHIKSHIEKSKKNASFSKEFAQKYATAIVKLKAFLNSTEETLQKYPEQDQTLNALYARSIAYYKRPDLLSSLNNINKLIYNYPKNPYFNELKGQILFENGKVKDSIKFYDNAISLLPGSALLKIQLATAQIATEDSSLLNNAITNLEKALLKEKRNVFAWRQLAIAYGRNGDLGMSNLALAEEAHLLGDKEALDKFIKLAQKHIKEGSPADLRLKDLLASKLNSK
ncbi:M48 family metalloprotease [Rickettsiales bacterium]|nr:M48 family metalloprotease [Rickettsiales bacterium]